MRKPAIFLVLVITALLASAVAVAVAQDLNEEEVPAEPQQEYLVELLFFRNLDGEIGTQERWSPRPVEPEPEAEAENAELAMEEEEIEVTEEMLAAEEEKRAARESVARASRSAFQLLDLSRRLASSGNYEPIAHIGWTQPGYLLEIAPTFDIDAALASRGRLSGTAIFSKGRYLRLDVDVEYRPQGSRAPLVDRQDSRANAGLIQALPRERMFYIAEQRRSIRSNEIHYFDNPAFGIVAQITPLLTEEPEEDLPEQASAGQWAAPY